MINTLKIAIAASLLAFPALADTYNTTATVTAVTPMYRDVSVPVTIQDCQNVQVPIYGNVRSGGNTVEGAIGGAIVGALIGDALGGKNERNAGAIFGAIVGGDKAANGTRQVVTGYRTERQCTNATAYETQQQLTDYLITYKVFGVEQQANVANQYRVGDRIQVQVTIQLR